VDTVYIQSAVFNDVNTHADSLQNWSQEYDQLSSGLFEGRLEDIQLDSVRLFRESMKQSVMQNTHTPNNKINFMIPNHIQSEKTSDQARQILSADVTILPYDSDFSFAAPPETDYTIISVTQERLRPLFSDEVYSQLLSLRHSHGVSVNAEVITKARNKLINIIHQLTSSLDDQIQNQIALNQQLKSVQDHIMLTVIELCDWGLDDTPSLKRLGNQHNYIVQRCHDYVTSADGSSASIVDICEMLNIPHRTLNYSFRKATGISPVHYLRAIKLNAARRELLTSQLPITDIAANYGFFHMGYFAKEYKRLFGDTPSMTRKAIA
jgi:AraC family ethanolamine operon transcriptional activator